MQEIEFHAARYGCPVDSPGAHSTVLVLHTEMTQQHWQAPLQFAAQPLKQPISCTTSRGDMTILAFRRPAASVQL
jgi:hypothetical protein